MADALSTAIMLGLRHGAPAHAYADALERLQFDPQRAAGDPGLRAHTSLADCLTQQLRYAAASAAGAPEAPQQQAVQGAAR